MTAVLHSAKPLSVSPLKISAPLGAALAFMGLDGSLPLFHGSQGCTAFALVMMVRHFREAIPLQTTAMNELSTILGGAEHVEQALLNIVKRAQPKVIGLVSTALTETRGEDLAGDLKAIVARNPQLAETAIVHASAPDFEGSLETGWASAVTALIDALVEPQPSRPAASRKVAVLAGAQLTPGDLDEIKEMVEAFGLEPVMVPDLAGSLDGHVPDAYVPTTLGGATLEQIRQLGRAAVTIAVGEHMRAPAEHLAIKAGVPAVVFDRLTGLDAVDRLVVLLSEVSGRPVPRKLRRQRSQLVDAMLDGHFFFGGRRVAVAGEPALVTAMVGLAAELGAEVAAAVTTRDCPGLELVPAERVVIGDFEDLEDAMLEAGGVDLVIANANARQLCARHGVPLFRAGFPVFDRLGAAHLVTVGYRGSRDLVFSLGNILMESPGHGHDAPLAPG
ncbi:MAG: nitrogenase iron-molybdenum cofactor biosynthesis protein NifN [Actinomycetota bacterium]